MNIVVAMKQVADLQQIRIRDRKPILDGVPLTLGNLDKNALEAAVQLKEVANGKVIVISAGDENLEDTIKEALAAGADEAILLADDALTAIQSAQSAQLLAAMIEKTEDVGLILLGEGSADNYSGQVASRVAALLGIPQVGYAKKIELEGNTARVLRSLEDCEELVEVELPAVISVVADINEIRIPSVTQILKAGKKPKQVFSLSDLDIDLSKALQIAGISNLAPESKRKAMLVKNVDELVKLLKSEGLIGR